MPAPLSNSFKLCGVNLNTNGSEDRLIHCFKEGEPCQNGGEQLISQLDVLDEPDRPNQFDRITDSDVDDEAGNAVFRGSRKSPPPGKFPPENSPLEISPLGKVPLGKVPPGVRATRVKVTRVMVTRVRVTRVTTPNP